MDYVCIVFSVIQCQTRSCDTRPDYPFQNDYDLRGFNIFQQNRG